MAVDLPSMVKMDEPQKKSILDSSIRSPIGSTEIRVWIDCKLETDPLVISFSVAVHDCGRISKCKRPRAFFVFDLDFSNESKTKIPSA